MSHLSDEQLAAALDTGATGPDAGPAGRHLATCEACRARLAEMAALDRELAQALEHDPGEAYFASFADRVAARIETAPAAAAAAPRRGAFAWWNSPRSLAWAGGLASLVLVSAVTFAILQRAPAEHTAAPPQASAPMAPAPATPAPPQAADQLTPQAGTNAPAPAGGGAPAQPLEALGGARRMREAAPRTQRPAPTAAPPAPAAARAPVAQNEVIQPPANAPDARAQHVRTLPNGEQEVVGSGAPPVLALRKVEPGAVTGRFARPPAQPMSATADAAPGRAAVREDATLEEKSRRSTFGSLSQSGAGSVTASKSLAALQGPAGFGAHARVCGSVRDARGQALAGATVMLVESGAATRTGGDGAFCVELSGAHGTLQVLAMGYRGWVGAVAPRDTAGALAITLHPVDVLGRAGAARAWDDALGASAAAARSPSVEAWTHAAESWDAAGAAAASEADRADARFHVAEARLRAWRIGRTEPQRIAARGALDAWLAGAPAGPLRDLAQGWAHEVDAAGGGH